MQLKDLYTLYSANRANNIVWGFYARNVSMDMDGTIDTVGLATLPSAGTHMLRKVDSLEQQLQEKNTELVFTSFPNRTSSATTASAKDQDEAPASKR